MKIRICGVGIKSSEASLAMVDFQDGEMELILQGSKKLKLKDDSIAANVQSFHASIVSFAHENKIDTFVIKSRNSRGAMGSGGITFKIEGLFQMQSEAKVEFMSPGALTSVSKSNFGALPVNLLKYQTDAYLAAAAYLKKL